MKEILFTFVVVLMGGPDDGQIVAAQAVVLATNDVQKDCKEADKLVREKFSAPEMWVYTTCNPLSGPRPVEYKRGNKT